MKIDTEEKKICYILGYLQALAQQHDDEFGREIEDVKAELLKGLKKRQSKPQNFEF